jgi:hypothetical protein
MTYVCVWMWVCVGGGDTERDVGKSLEVYAILYNIHIMCVCVCVCVCVQETGAKSPAQGAEASMRLLFGGVGGGGGHELAGEKSGRFYAMSKDMRTLLHSSIDRRPDM